MDNTRDLLAYSFMKNIDVDDHDSLVKLINPLLYEGELARKQYEEHKITLETYYQMVKSSIENEHKFSYKKNPGLDLKIQRDRLKSELYKLLSIEDRRFYVYELLVGLQYQYVLVRKAFKDNIGNSDLRGVYAIYMHLLFEAMHDIVRFVGLNLKIVLDKKSILVLQDMYKLSIDQFDVGNFSIDELDMNYWVKICRASDELNMDRQHILDMMTLYMADLECIKKMSVSLYPSFYEEMLKMRCIVYGETTAQFEASIQKEIKAFAPIFNLDRMKILWCSLCEGQFIDKGTLEEHFLFWFGKIQEEPENLCPINWIGRKCELGYFVTQYCRAAEQDYSRTKWKITQSVFKHKGKSLGTKDINTIKSYMSKLEVGDKKRTGELDKIDKLLKK